MFTGFAEPKLLMRTLPFSRLGRLLPTAWDPGAVGPSRVTWSSSSLALRNKPQLLCSRGSGKGLEAVPRGPPTRTGVEHRRDFLWGGGAVGGPHKEGTADPLLPLLETLFKATVHTLIMNCKGGFTKLPYELK